jgi:hypothetical protein
MERLDVTQLEPSGLIFKPLLLAGALATATFLPHHDEGRLLPALSCSLVSESEASQALHADMLLEPSDGHICRFVSSEPSAEDVALILVAREGANDAAPVHPAVQGATQLVISGGARHALLILEDQRDSDDLRDQTARSLGRLVARRLAARP